MYHKPFFRIFRRVALHTTGFKQPLGHKTRNLGNTISTSRTKETNILVLSDTHDHVLPPLRIYKRVDVLIHCGDLTKCSTLAEMKRAVRYLDSLPIGVKLIIAGNHEIMLDAEAFSKHLAAAGVSDLEVTPQYGMMGHARALFTGSSSLTLLDEGNYRFTLPNGARLLVYASPWTPQATGGAFDPGWAFKYPIREGPAGGHEHGILPNTDIAITHGPPRGILDSAGRAGAGCPDLFAAVARAQPKLHCFGHIHAGWGAREVTWRPQLPKYPTHLNAIDDGKDRHIMDLKDLRAKKADRGAAVESKREEEAGLEVCEAAISGTRGVGRTLFVNAAIEGHKEMPLHPPWLISMMLPMAD